MLFNFCFCLQNKKYKTAVAFFDQTLEKSLFLHKIFKNMIQRIQTLYLLISAILLGLLYFLPFAEIAKDGTIFLFNSKGILLNDAVQKSGLGISLLIGIIVALHGAAVLDYKKRLRQLRLIIIAILLIMVLFGMFYFFTFLKFSGAQISYKISMVFPLIALILDYLAIRAIGKDEALIRSIDRIR